MPLLSIGLPVYNSQEYLEEVIQSLIVQSFTDFELIISDDKSNDNTINICQRFSAVDQRIIIYKQDINIGMVRNQNFVLSKANGKYFMWAAHDDYYHKEFIKELLFILEENPKMVSAFCNTAVFSTLNDKSIKMFSLDFSNKSALRRLIRFTYIFNDAHFYGIHLRNALINTEVPVWWGKNKITPANTNYPVLFYLLSLGEYGYLNGNPLFYKRQKKENYSLGPSRTLIQQILFLIIRKVNLFILCCSNVHKARRNPVITLSIIPFLVLRINYDLIKEILYLLKLNIRLFR
jgi:glycosyltransferase involved in cell wall biosynthesis